MKWNLQTFAVFVAAVRHHSITGAADSLGMSQPAASTYIKALEDALGVKLLERSARGVELSPEGQEIYLRATRVLAEQDDLELMAGSQAEPRGRLKVCASSTPGAYWLPAQLRRFREQYPGIQPIPSLADSSEVIHAVMDLQCPMGLVGDLAQLEGRSLVAQPVAADELVLMCPPGNPLVGVKRLQPQHFKGQTLLRRETGSSTRQQSDELLKNYLDAFESVIELNRNEALRECILAGLGVGVLSTWSGARELESGRLCRVRDSRFSRRRTFHLVRRADRELHGAAAVLWNFFSGAK